MDKIKVAAYCRVSTSSKDQKNSFNNQKSYFEDIEKSRDNYELVNIYADEGISGVRLNKRESFLRMIYDAGVNYEIDGNDYKFIASKRKPKFTRIMFKDISRFSRNIDIIPLYRKLIQKGVSLELVTQGRVYSTETDESFLSFLLTFAQDESVQRGEKIRFGIRKGAVDGTIRMSRDLYGYHWNPDKKEIEVVEEEAEIVRFIFDLYVNKNLGVRRIGQILREKGIKTRKNKDFGSSTLTRMLDNRKYCGDIVYLKYTAGTVLNKFKSNRIKPKDEWIIHEDKFIPIVSKELFAKAAELKEERLKEKLHLKSRHSPLTEYAKMIRCSQCGAFYGRNRANGTYFYTCMTKKKFGKHVCDYPNFKATDIDNIIKKLGDGELYKSILFQKNDKIESLKLIRQQLEEKKTQDIPPEYFVMKEEIVKVNLQKEKLLELYLDGKFDKAMLDSKVNAFNKKIQSLETEIRMMGKPIDELEAQISLMDQQIEDFGKLKIKKTFSKEEVIDLIDQIDVKHVFTIIEFAVKLKVGSVMNKAMETLDLSEEQKKELETPVFLFSIPASKHVQSRMPETLYVLKDDVPEEAINEMKKLNEERSKRYDELTKE